MVRCSYYEARELVSNEWRGSPMIIDLNEDQTFWARYGLIICSVASLLCWLALAVLFAAIF